MKSSEIKVGDTFGKLSVVEIIKYDGKTTFRCRCECGNEKILKGYVLIKGITKSCGCFRKERSTVNSTKYTRNDKKLSREYDRIKSFCYNKNNRFYHLYGGSNIQICCDWLNNKQKFIDWAYDNGYKKELSLNRKDITGNFSPENCYFCSSSKKRSNSTLLSHIKKRKDYPDWFINELANDKDKKNAKAGILSTKEIVIFKCTNGHYYKQKVNDHINLLLGEKRWGCPICAKKRSNAELEIEEYVNSLGYMTEHKRFTSLNGKSFEIDIFIPDKNIGIEYNGSYFHCTLPKHLSSKDRFYHQTKYLECKRIGIKLISIFDVDWFHRKDKITSYLKDLLCDKERIQARKCEVKRVSFRDANAMYEKYHLLGSTKLITLTYGLYYQNELVSVMSFQNGRYDGWCLTRFVTKFGITLVGGASKLFKSFLKEVGQCNVVSFSDNDYFDGKIYDILGFENLNETDTPRYYWYLNGSEIKRESCQLGKLKKKYPELYNESINQCEIRNKEDYIMIKIGAYKVYRSGHTKWIYKLKD